MARSWEGGRHAVSKFRRAVGMKIAIKDRQRSNRSAFTSVPVGEHRWALMAEIDREEVVAIAAKERPALAGILALFYGLSLWSVWYWRGRELPQAGGDMTALSTDNALGVADDGGGGMGGA